MEWETNQIIQSLHLKMNIASWFKVSSLKNLNLLTKNNFYYLTDAWLFITQADFALN